MSQEAAGVRVSGESVRNAVASLIDRGKAMISNLSSVSDSVATAADNLSILGDADKVAEYRGIMLTLGKLTHEVNANQEVLSHLRNTYQPSLEDTDFKVLLDQALQEQLRKKPYDSRSDPQIDKFDKVTKVPDGQAGGDDDDDLDEDEDVVIESGNRAWPSDKCPLSMKPVLELDDPVKDTLGYVYEKAFVMQYVRGYPNGAKHPFAGVTSLLHKHDLSPAVEVIRAKRRQRVQKALRGDVPEEEKESQEIIDV